MSAPTNDARDSNAIGTSINLEGKVVGVIGAASGIGAAVAQGCVDSGATVACLDLDGAGAEETARSLGTNASAEALNITDSQATQSTLGRIVERHGALHGLVCTPAVNVRKPLLQYTSDDFDQVVGLNLKGSLHVLQAAGAIMANQGYGSIVVFSSIRSQVVEPGQGVYAATKAGILQMMRAAAAELGSSGVRVNAIAPGVVETPLTEPIKSQPDWYRAYAERNILRRWAQPHEMAGPTTFLLSDAASYVTGTVIYVDGGWTAIDGRFSPPGMEQHQSTQPDRPEQSDRGQPDLELDKS